MTKLRETALAPPWRGTPWCGPDDFPDVTKLKGKREVSIELAAPLGRVHGILAKLLKPERTLLNVVRFTDGRMEEITDWAEPESGYRDDAKSGAEAKALAKADEKPAAAAGTTVAQPTRGCPVPDFEKAEVRATAVLQAFLTSEQIADFERHQRFVTVGADTGHRYMLTSRLARDELGSYGGRSLFDLEERRSYCVHDYTVPAAEELLALHLFVSLPGRERYVRRIPDLGLD